eukprot:5454011-Amphidinium_carterae.1
MRLASSKTACFWHLVCFFPSTAARYGLLARSALSRQTCDTEFDATDTSAEQSRIQIGASWQLEGLQDVVCSVRSDLSVGLRTIQH